MSFRRHKMSRAGSARHFSRHAARTHRRNVAPVPMRGGIRL